MYHFVKIIRRLRIYFYYYNKLNNFFSLTYREKETIIYILSLFRLNISYKINPAALTNQRVLAELTYPITAVVGGDCCYTEVKNEDAVVWISGVGWLVIFSI